MTVPAIFLTTIVSLFLIVALATLLGRPFALCFPHRTQPLVRFYLAPAFGLAALQLFIAVLGRYVPIGDSVLPPLVLALALAAVLYTEPSARSALADAGLVGLYAIFTSGSMLVPLLVFGGYNSFNDAFTYLAHGDWLQHHAFRQTIPGDDITAPFTQVSLYQQYGFRMGGTYLLALFQSLLNLRWSYDAYPAIVFAPVSALCLACGLPLAGALRRFSRPARLAILSIPAYSLGGVVFAASYGFLPQSYGQMFSAAALFVYGPLLPFIADQRLPLRRRLVPALALAVLIAASVFSYSELSPFLLAALGLSTLLFAFWKRTWLPYLWFGLLTGALAALLLNVELARTIRAIIVQKDAIVGTPVNWGLIAYLAHALGIHGGAWDLSQWARRPLDWHSAGLLAGTAAMLFLVALLPFNYRRLRTMAADGRLLPAAALLGLFVMAFVYFRYAVPSPFPVGTGQSWSQFKLADWAQPVVFTLLALTIVPALAFNRVSRAVAVGLALAIVVVGGWTAAARIAPLQAEFPGVRNLKSFYLGVRDAVERECKATPAVYLDFDRPEIKIRQILGLFMADRRLKSDWSGDDYIEAQLPPQRRHEPSQRGDCFIELASEHPGEDGVVVGKLKIGVYQSDAAIKIVSFVDDYPRESDASGWWLWVKNRVAFETQLVGKVEAASDLEFRFKLLVLTPQTITATTKTADGQSKTFTFKLAAGGHDLTLPVDGAVTSVEFVTDDPAPRYLSPQDPRLASFMIRNFRSVERKAPPDAK